MCGFHEILQSGNLTWKACPSENVFPLKSPHQKIPSFGNFAARLSLKFLIGKQNPEKSSANKSTQKFCLMHIYDLISGFINCFIFFIEKMINNCSNANMESTYFSRSFVTISLTIIYP